MFNCRSLSLLVFTSPLLLREGWGTYLNVCQSRRLKTFVLAACMNTSSCLLVASDYSLNFCAWFEVVNSGIDDDLDVVRLDAVLIGMFRRILLSQSAW